MRYIVALAMALLLPQAVAAATLVCSEDFESTGWESNFRSGAWSGKVARVDTLAHGGTWALRGNLMEAGGNDPITGLPGEGNPVMEFACFTGDTPDTVYISFWMRLDGATWSGPTSGMGKTMYITDDNVSTTAYYFTADHVPNAARLSDNGAWQAWCFTNWGYPRAYLGQPEVDPGGPDNQWHQYELMADYINNDIRFWIDGVQLDARGSRAHYYLDGIVPIHPDFHMRGLQLLYVANAQVSTSSDGTGYACGYMFDDFEVWDGMPSGGGSPPPGNITPVDTLRAVDQ